MGSLLVITGPPGAGKSTLAARLAERLDHSVLVQGDAFFGFLRSDAIAPWLAAAERQNTIVTAAAGAAAGRFASGGLHTVYDGVIGPWFVDQFLAASGLGALDYVMLLPPVELCVERVATRESHAFTDEGATRKMHEEFARPQIAPRHVVSGVPPPADALADQILAARQEGAFAYPATR